MLHKDHILVIGDTHIPFTLKGYLDFCLDIQKRVKCGTIVHIGDGVDNSSLSYHYDANPNGRSPADEIKEAREGLKPWFRAFPRLFYCLGNHCRRVSEKAHHSHLPEDVFRPFRDIWGLPKGWVDKFHHELYGVRFQHGTGYSGDMAHMKAAYNNRQSTVIGHTHSVGAVGYIANEKDCIFGMNVGCGIDRDAYAFTYGKDFNKKPIIGVGVVTDNGRFAQFFPMSL